MKTIITLLASLALTSATFADGEWISLFNGKDLNGWTVKVNGFKAGENPGSLFRVEDGLLTVSYADFWKDSFKDEFGHIFIDRPFTNYHFRCEYRFIGEQVNGGPGWAQSTAAPCSPGRIRKRWM